MKKSKYTQILGGLSSREGFVLPAILLVAVIGVLFGFGRVMLYRFQCQLRIDRQHELEKQYAVRSALRWLETRKVNDLDMTGEKAFEELTFSDRNLQVEVHPVTPIYPCGEGMFYITNEFTYVYSERSVFDGEGTLVAPTNSNYRNVYPDYQDGRSASAPMRHGCQMGPGGEATTNWMGRVSVDMEGTGNWLQDVYGRRYMFNADNINKAASGEKADWVRFYVTPMGKTAAIGLTMYPRNPDRDTRVDLWFRSESGVETVVAENVLANEKGEGKEGNNGKGLQLASDKVTVYHWVQAGYANIVGTYDFSETYEIPQDLLYEFTNATQEVTMTLEVVNKSGVSSESLAQTRNLFNRFQVLPAYEYEVYLNWEDSGKRNRELATVVHVKPNGRARGTHQAFTYDTHGTSVRGYRKKRNP